MTILNPYTFSQLDPELYVPNVPGLVQLFDSAMRPYKLAITRNITDWLVRNRSRGQWYCYQTHSTYAEAYREFRKVVANE